MRRTFAILGAALLLTGCGEQRPATDTPQEQPRAAATPAAAAEAEWNAELRPGEGHPGVRGSTTARTRAGMTTVNVELTGGAPGATHPWHIHRGTCGNDQGYFHEPETYPPLQLDDSGRGTVQATVPAELQPGEPFYVNVHGAEDHDDTVACGELRRS